MIARPKTRPQSLLQAVAKPSFTLPRRQLRSKHDLAQWADPAKQEVFAKHGVPGFLSAKTYEDTYLRYSRHLIDQLNTWTQGTPDEAAPSVYALHVTHAHRPEKAHVYNHAAMLHHTSFFWQSLSPAVEPTSAAVQHGLIKTIDREFGSLDDLRAEMLEAADALFGNGFVWLMADDKGHLSLLCTYNAGSPWPEASSRRDDRDMANVDNRGASTASSSSVSSILAGRSNSNNVFGRAGAFGNNSARAATHFLNALDAEPILCASVWQHQYIPDYGVLGKRAYLANWWDKIDWQVVIRRYAHIAHNQDYGYGTAAATGGLAESLRGLGKGRENAVY